MGGISSDQPSSPTGALGLLTDAARNIGYDTNSY